MTQDPEAKILYWLLIGLDSWGTALRRNGPGDWWARRCDDGRGRLPAWCYKHVGVAYDPTAWAEIGEEPPPDAAERQALSRALRSLEEAGVVTVDRRGNGRAGYMRPAPRGLQVALTLHTDADPLAIREAIKTAVWGTPQHLAAIRDVIRSETSRQKREEAAAEKEIGNIPEIVIRKPRARATKGATR